MKDKIITKIIENRKRNTIIAKASITKHYSYKAKGGNEKSESFFAEFAFADIHKDKDGDEIAQSTLELKLDGMKGDLEHCNLKDLPGFDKQHLFEVVKSFYQGDKMLGMVKFNTDHEQFPAVWDHIQNDNFGISLEYLRRDGIDTVSGLSGALDPRNERSKLIHAFTA